MTRVTNNDTKKAKMQLMKQYFTALIAASALAASSASAQMMPFGGGAGSAAMNPTIAKLFGTATAASATAQFNIKDSRGQNIEMEMLMSMRDGKTRMEMDLTQIKGSKMPPNSGAQLKRMGMDKMVTISLPEKASSLMIYPGLHAYAEMSAASYGGPGSPGGSAAPESGGQNGKVEKTSLGKETIDGHNCEKSKVVFTNDKGDRHEATVWNATDLKDFPVQMQITERDNDITIKYRDIKLEKPDASLFEAPADFTKYDSMQVMMQTEMMKRMGGGGLGR